MPRRGIEAITLPTNSLIQRDILSATISFLGERKIYSL
jgi:hypothetical protein